MLLELLCADVVHAVEAWWDEKDSKGCHCPTDEGLTDAERDLAYAIWQLQEADLLVAKVLNRESQNRAAALSEPPPTSHCN